MIIPFNKHIFLLLFNIMNKTIIHEFNKLLEFMKNELSQAEDDGNQADIKKHKFRISNTKKVLNIIKKLDFEITKDKLESVEQIDGIGKGSMKRFEEIIKKGYLEEVKNFKVSNKEQTLEELESVINIGRTKARELYKKGVTSVDDLKKKQKSGEIEVNDKIKMGLKYHNVIETGIPRKEVTQIYNYLQKQVKNLSKQNKINYEMEVCGSYRRGKSHSNDIDVILTTKVKSKNNHLKSFVEFLKDEGFLVDDLTDYDKTKYMGFCKYKNNPVRRIDIRYIEYKSFYTAILYFTGSKDFNKEMRQVAKDKGYKLSEYCLQDLKTKECEVVNSEKDVFDLLNMKYVDPVNR